MNNHIILIGFMGCGKSTIGKKLAEKQNRLFLDTDEWIEEKEGMTISKIFEQKGEAYFRDLETACLKEILSGQGSWEEEEFFSQNENCAENQDKRYDTVISVGGGLPVREENRELLKKLGQVIYLKASSDTIYERVKEDTARPLLQTANPQQKIQEMMAAREEKYQAAAHDIIEADGKSIEKIVEEIISLRNT